jgi:uncharacterized protein (DUF1501 family)
MSKIKVIVQLNGGCDGLNTVIHDSAYYYDKRGSMAIPQKKVLKLTDMIGLHPSMNAMRDLFMNGQLGIIQNVGVVKPSFSHFRATDIWHSASDSEVQLNTGWIGRELELTPANDRPRGLRIGTVPSLAFQGATSVPGITISGVDGFYDFLEGIEPVDPTKGLGRLAYIRQIRSLTETYTLQVKKAADFVKAQLVYPDTSLAAQLKIVARLIAGGLETKVYMVSMTGFDTHADQINAGDSTTGTHAKLLKEMSDAIGAFMADLEFLQVADDVVGMTYSEFGRAIKPNGNLGTDHGHGAPLFYFGKSIHTNQIIGSTPDLSGDVVPIQYDFRQVYASLLKWSGADDKAVLFKEFETLPLFDTGGSPEKQIEEIIQLHKLGKKYTLFTDKTWE